jgi:hypothetical protein
MMKAFITALSFLFGSALFAQLPALVPDPSGVTTYLVPRGWTPSAQQQNGVFTWVAAAPSGSPAPVVAALAMPDAEVDGRAAVRSMLGEVVQDPKVLHALEDGPREAHYQVAAMEQGREVRITFHFLRDVGKMLFVHYFKAEPNEHARLGGDALLYACIQRPDPFAGGAVTAEMQQSADAPAVNAIAASALNMQDDAVKRAILGNGAPVDAARLHGRWMQAMGAMTGMDYQNIVTGEISMGSRGFGHVLEFAQNGTYTLSYLYNANSGGCLNRAEMNERGRYQVSGNELVLTPQGYAGTYIVCGQRTVMDEKQVPVRRFQLGLHPGGDHLVIMGKPFEYSISTDTDASGQPFIREGFQRLR